MLFCAESNFPCGNRVKFLQHISNIGLSEPTFCYVLSNGVPKG